MKNKTIKFISARPDIQIPHPVPASRLVPEWYRKMPGAAEQIETVKKCVPVLDALTSGYMITLPTDVYFNNENKNFWYDAPFDINSDHHEVQTQGVDIGSEYDEQPHKWVNQWLIQTPKGYSCLFIHPLNRMDLPFRSFTGIVDTDRHPLIINFPFVMKKDFYGKIPEGTPIIQIIPFKRDDWKADVVDDKAFKDHPEAHEVENPPFNWYKRKWWTRKVYS
jgi:hypothetical protein